MNRDQADFDAGRPLKYHTPAIKREQRAALAKKKEMAGKMSKAIERKKLKNDKGRLIHGERVFSDGRQPIRGGKRNVSSL